MYVKIRTYVSKNKLRVFYLAGHAVENVEVDYEKNVEWQNDNYLHSYSDSDASSDSDHSGSVPDRGWIL
jgi:hypothetical protein